MNSNARTDMIRELQQVEVALIDGTTRAALALRLGCSERQVSRHLSLLRQLGVVITSDYQSGAMTPGIYRLKKSTRVFR